MWRSGLGQMSRSIAAKGHIPRIVMAMQDQLPQRALRVQGTYQITQRRLIFPVVRGSPESERMLGADNPLRMSPHHATFPSAVSGFPARLLPLRPLLRQTAAAVARPPLTLYRKSCDRDSDRRGFRTGRADPSCHRPGVLNLLRRPAGPGSLLCSGGRSVVT